MKVKELVANLLELDQERDICVLYDYIACLEPEINVAEEDGIPVKEGDYYFQASC